VDVETKNQWARDDPAFVAVTILLLIISSVAYGVALQLPFLGVLELICWVVFVKFLGVGLLVSLVNW